MDQFAEGLKSLGVLDMMKRHPDLFESLFVDGGSPPLTPGTCMCIVRYIPLCLWKSLFSSRLVSCTYTNDHII